MPAHPWPSHTTSFVGRRNELAEIDRLLSDPTCRLLTLLGPGGMGKTRLAREVINRSIAADRAVFVPLQPLSSPEFVVSAIADAAGVQLYLDTEPKQQLVSFLAENVSLLVLDNFEHLLDASPFLVEILAHVNGIRLLVTSRERLNLVEEWTFPLHGLPVPVSDADSDRDADADTDVNHGDAVDLFVQHAHRADSMFALTPLNRSAVFRICRQLDGIPLAIELAAAWVRVLSCSAISDEIARSTDLLETPLRNVEPRHRSIRAAFEPTWNRLSSEERTVFSKLAVFRGGCTSGAAQVVTGASVRVLSSLVDKSLLSIDHAGRYSLHELMRQFAEEQLKHHGDFEATRAQHSAFFADFLNQKWEPLRTSEQMAVLDEIDLEFKNIVVAWQSMVERVSTVELSQSIYSLWWFGDLRSHHFELLPLFKQAEAALLTVPLDVKVTRTLGQILTKRGSLTVEGSFTVEMSKPAEGRELVRNGLTLLREVGSDEDIFLALDNICQTSFYLHDYGTLIQAGAEALEIGKRLNNAWMQARILCWLSYRTYRGVGEHVPDENQYTASYGSADLAEITQIARMAFDQAEQCGDPLLRAMAANCNAYMCGWAGDYRRAKPWFEYALKLHEQLGAARGIAVSHFALGDILFWLRDHTGAAFHYRQALTLFEQYGGYTSDEINTLLGVARLWRARHNLGKAVEILTICVHHSRYLDYQRNAAERVIEAIRKEASSDALTLAQERGRRSDFKTAVKAIIVDLGVIAMPTISHDLLDGSSHPGIPLTERELEVLRLAASGHSNGQIARQLLLTQNTVKSHIHHIFNKLGVDNRMQAVARARELHLL